MDDGDEGRDFTDDDEASENQDRYIRLRLDDVRVDERHNVRRRPYSREEIEARAVLLLRQPLLHPPTVFERDDGGFELVTGYGRYFALRAAGREETVFRLVDAPDRRTRLLLMGAENLGRKRMTGAERVEYVWELVEHERMPIDGVARHLGFTERYVRSLLRIRREACPELLRAFAEEDVSIRRMTGLVSHAPDQQMTRLRDGERWHRRADSIEQGAMDYPPDHDPEECAEDDGFMLAYEGGTLPSFALSAASAARPARRSPRPPRKRSPSVREHRQMLDALDEVSGVDPSLLEGMRRVFRWAVYGEDIPELPATALRRARHNLRRRERRAERRAREQAEPSANTPASPSVDELGGSRDE